MIDLIGFMGDALVLNSAVEVAADAGQVTTKINAGIKVIQTVLTSVLVGVGICVALFNVVTKLPTLSDPHEKNQFWKTQGYILGGVAFGAVVVWLVPWVYSLFT